MRIVSTDVEARVFGKRFGHTRTFGNTVEGISTFINGNRWYVRGPFARAAWYVYETEGMEHLTYVIYLDANTILWFEQSGLGGNFEYIFSGNFRLQAPTILTGLGDIKVSGPSGKEWVFGGPNDPEEGLRGRLKTMKESNGIQQSFTYDNGRLASVTQAHAGGSAALAYSYASNADGVTRLSIVKLSLNGSEVSRASYTYCEILDAQGSPGDLRHVVREVVSPLGGWVVTGESYYTYYPIGSGPLGSIRMPKYVLEAEAVFRLRAAGLNPESATDTQLASFADFYFEYDQRSRVTLERVRGGAFQHTFEYEPRQITSYTGFNFWVSKTIETLPDGNQKIAYCNWAGQVMLLVFRASATEEEWMSGWRFNEHGAVVLKAEPSAIAGYDEQEDTLFTLHEEQGLVRHFEKVTPSSGPAVIRRTYVSEGELGDRIKLEEREFILRSTSGGNIYVPSKITIFQSEVGDGDPAATEFNYLWHTNTFQMSRRETKLPIVPVEQNGSWLQATRIELFNIEGQVTSLTDERGVVTTHIYDAATGAPVQTVQDLAELHLVTEYEHDLFGRTTQELGPEHTIDLNGLATVIRRARWTVYRDDIHEQWEAQGYATASGTGYDYTLINPVTITRVDRAGRVTNEIEAIRSTTPGRLQPTDSFGQSSWVRWRHFYFDNASRMIQQRVYVKIPSTGPGFPGTNYNQTMYGYDAMGRRTKTLSPGGTITKHVLNARGWESETHIGTNDAPSGGDMVLVTEKFYEGSAGKNGNLTRLVLQISSVNSRLIQFSHDFRNRRTSTIGVSFFEGYEYDNADRITKLERRIGSAGGPLASQRTVSYDTRNRVYKRARYFVDPQTGALGNALQELTWYDAAGNVIKHRGENGRGFEKTTFDSLGRAVATYVACNPDAATYEEAQSVEADFVLEQTENVFDAGGNLIFQRVRERNHDAPLDIFGKGALKEPFGNEPRARVRYHAFYADALGRTMATVDWGTHGGIAPERPAETPIGTDTVLVSFTRYDAAGNVFESVSPLGTLTRNTFDATDQLTRTIENYLPGATGPDANRTTDYVYNADGRLTSLIARNAFTGDQHTSWIYGTSLSDSGVASFDLVRTKVYPDSTSTGDWVQYAYNRIGQLIGTTDQNGTVHQFDYDELGRLLHDRVTLQSGSQIDPGVLQISRTYNSRGFVEKITSADQASPFQGTITNEILLEYNGFDQLTREYQSHNGEVDTATTPHVDYTYADGSQNTIRRLSTTYPNGRIVTWGYGDFDSIDNLTDRVSTIVDDQGEFDLVAYTRRGIKSTVRVQYLEPGVELTYLRQPGEPLGDAGDDYTGLDRFNQIEDIRWMKTATAEDVDRFQYGFDRAGQRTWRRNRTAPEENFDESYSYDALGQLIALARGSLNLNQLGTKAIPEWEEQFNYDATGNWRRYQTCVDGAQTLDQPRTHNRANEITAIDLSAATVAYDAAGNMVKMPKVGEWNTAQNLRWDAWNRLVRITQGSTTIGEYRYDGFTRRIFKQSPEEGLTVARHFYYSDQWQVLEERLGDAPEAERQFIWGLRYRDDLVLRDRFAPPEPSSSSSSSESSESSASSGSSAFFASTGAASITSTWPERLYATHDQWHCTGVLSASGAVIERYAYEAFGASVVLTPAFATRASSLCDWETRFGAYRFDKESNLYYVRFRYLHPHIGRWMSRDPLVLAEVAASSNPDETGVYSYMHSDPIRGVDSFGLFSDEDLRDCHWKCLSQVWGFDAPFDLSDILDPLKTLLEGGLIIGGLPIVGKRFKMKNSSIGTSIISQYFHNKTPPGHKKHFMTKKRWAPTLRRPFSGTVKRGAFLGRWIPYIGVALLLIDITRYGICLDQCLAAKGGGGGGGGGGAPDGQPNPPPGGGDPSARFCPRKSGEPCEPLAYPAWAWCFATGPQLPSCDPAIQEEVAALGCA